MTTTPALNRSPCGDPNPAPGPQSPSLAGLGATAAVSQRRGALLRLLSLPLPFRGLRSGRTTNTSRRQQPTESRAEESKANKPLAFQLARQGGDPPREGTPPPVFLCQQQPPAPLLALVCLDPSGVWAGAGGPTGGVCREPPARFGVCCPPPPVWLRVLLPLRGSVWPGCASSSSSSPSSSSPPLSGTAPRATPASAPRSPTAAGETPSPGRGTPVSTPSPRGAASPGCCWMLRTRP